MFLVGLTCPWPFSPIHDTCISFFLSCTETFSLISFHSRIQLCSSGDIFGVQHVAAGESLGFVGQVSFCFMICSVGHKHNGTPGLVSTLSLCSGNVQLGGSPWDVPSRPLSKDDHGSSCVPGLVLGLVLIFRS